MHLLYQPFTFIHFRGDCTQCSLFMSIDLIKEFIAFEWQRESVDTSFALHHSGV